MTAATLGCRGRIGRGTGGLVLIVAALLGPLVLLAPAAVGAAPATTAGVAAALERTPVYVDPLAAPPAVDASRLLKVVPSGTYFAALPRSILVPGGDPATLPAELSGQVGRGGTFIVLLGGRLYGASTTIPGRLGTDLGAAQSSLPTAGATSTDATDTLVNLMRALAGSGNLQDASGPSRAGGPVGAGFLVAMIVVIVGGGLGLWWWIRRPPRRRARPSPPLRDLVEIDYAGRIIKQTPASEREVPRD